MRNTSSLRWFSDCKRSHRSFIKTYFLTWGACTKKLQRLQPRRLMRWWSTASSHCRHKFKGVLFWPDVCPSPGPLHLLCGPSSAGGHRVKAKNHQGHDWRPTNRHISAPNPRWCRGRLQCCQDSGPGKVSRTYAKLPKSVHKPSTTSKCAAEPCALITTINTKHNSTGSQQQYIQRGRSKRWPPVSDQFTPF